MLKVYVEGIWAANLCLINPDHCSQFEFLAAKRKKIAKLFDVQFSELPVNNYNPGQFKVTEETTFKIL